MKWPDFLHVDTNSHKLNVDQNNFGWAWSKMDVASLITTLKLTVSQEIISRFFASWYKLRKAKSWFNDFWVGVV